MTAIACELQIPDAPHLVDFIRDNARFAKRMAQPNAYAGQTVAICGAGPSLADHLQEIDGHAVWACNSALPYLVDHGVRVTHGFTVDQGDAMVGPNEWGRTFDVDYLVASTIHPALRKHLRQRHRHLTWFHNFCGLKDPKGWTPPTGYEGQPHEFVLYSTLYPPGAQVGYGLNSTVRAVCLALWMGFARIRVFGADCAAKPTGESMPAWESPEWDPFLRRCVLYADGRTAFDAYGPNVTIVQHDMESRIGDPSTLTRWHTRPDMVISAMHLADVARDFAPGRVELVGHTLPNAMLDKPREWFATCPKLDANATVSGFTLVAA